MGAMHSLHKSVFFTFAFVSVYGYYDPQWRINFHWWTNWEFIQPNPELWERHEEYARRYVYDKLIHQRDFITQGGESHFHKWFCGRDNEGDWWGASLPPYDEVVDQIYRTESRIQRKKFFTDQLRALSEYPLPEFTGEKELPPNRIWSKVDETWRPKHFCLANLLWETDGFVDYFEELIEENATFEEAIRNKYKDPKLRELYWDARTEAQQFLGWDLYDLLPYISCRPDLQQKLSTWCQDPANTQFMRDAIKVEQGAHLIFDKAGIVPYGEGASASLLAKYDPGQGAFNEKFFF